MSLAEVVLAIIIRSSLAFIEKLVSDFPKQIVGVKDSGGDMDYFRELVTLKALRPDWTILVGPEHLLAETVQLGGDGGVNGGANVFPKLFTAMFKAAQAGDTDRIAILQKEVELDIYQASQEVRNQPSKCSARCVSLIFWQ